MKRLAIGLFLLAGSLVTINSYSQVTVHAGIGIPVPPTVVVYGRPHYPPQPVYRDYRMAPRAVVVDHGRRGRHDRWGGHHRYNHHNKHYKNNGRGKGHDKGRHNNDRHDNRRR